jgi:hypothetical protein
VRGENESFFSEEKFMDHSEVKYLPKVDHTPAELDEASKLLLRTADLIEDRGLACTAFDDEGRGCVIVTMCSLPGAPMKLVEEALDRVRRYIRTQARSGCYGIPSWSDKAAREGRAAEVISALRAVAFSS